MKKQIYWLIFIVLFLVGCSGNDNDATPEDNQDIPVNVGVSNNQIAENLHVPWAITKKETTFYISERHGSIVSINTETGDAIRLPVQLQKKLYTGGEGGFLGLELIPNTNLEAYAYHTYEEQGKVKNRVIRIEKQEDSWEEVDVLLEGIPGADIHNGGRIKIGPDQKLYVTAGDAANPDSAQNINVLSGKILRMELDGSIPADNPFQDSYIYSYGHRNPQGFTWTEDGQLYATEHGQSAHDEINRIEPGRNYGWPVIQGDEQQENMETPLYHTNGNTWAPSGIAYDNGSLYIATLRGEALRKFDLQTNEATILIDGNGRIRDVLIDNGEIYFITNNTDGRGNPAKNDDRLLKSVME